MTNSFINVLFDADDPIALQQRYFEHIQTYFPEWEPREPSLEVAQGELFTELIYELTVLAADVPPAIFQRLGELIQIEPRASRAATVQLQFTASDTAGHTVPGDTIVAWDVGEDTGIGFYTTSDAVIPNGQSTVTVTAICEVEGYIGNDFTGSPRLISLLDFVSGVTAVAPTANGQDQEPLTDFLDRFSLRLRLLKDRPVRDWEVAIWATTVMPFVGRAIAFDNYNANLASFDQERCCTLVAHDLDGDDLTTDQVNELMAALALTRETNFDFFYQHPTRWGIGVQVTVIAEEGWELDAVEQNVIDSLVSAFDPLNWGQRSSAQGPDWINRKIVRLGWVYSQISRLESVRYIDQDAGFRLRHSGMAGGTWLDDDLTLTGLAPLTYADLANITVTVLPTEEDS